MSIFAQIKNEILDQPLPFEWTKSESGGWVAEFQADEDTGIEVTFTDDFDQGIWYLKFHPTDSTRKAKGIRRRDRTKKMDLPNNLQFKVLATVLAISKEFISKTEPEVILFYPGRKYQQNLLDMFIKQIPKLASGYVGDKSTGAKTAYIIARSSQYLKKWKGKFHDFFGDPVEENREDMKAAEWVITENIEIGWEQWNWVVFDEVICAAQAHNNDGCSMTVTMSSMDEDDYQMHVTSEFSDPLTTFKTTLSIMQDFIMRRRPITMSIFPQEMSCAGGIFNDQFIPGYSVETHTDRIILRVKKPTPELNTSLLS